MVQNNQSEEMPIIFKWKLNVISFNMSNEVLSMATLTFCFMYLHYIKLNEIIKFSLKVYAFLLFLCSLGIFSGQLWMLLDDLPPKIEACALTLIPGFYLGALLSNMTMTISIVRYYMTWKATKAEIAKDHILLGFIGSNVVFTVVLYGLWLSLNLNIPIHPVLYLCARQPRPSFSYLTIVDRVILLFQLLVAIGFDRKLKRFLEDRKKASQGQNVHQLIPWKVGEKDEELSIPTRATCTSAWLLIFTIVGHFLMMTVVALAHENMAMLAFAPIAFVYRFLLNVQLPLIIFLTIKRKTSVAASQPPRELHFHE